MTIPKPGLLVKLTIVIVIGVCVGVSGFFYYLFYQSDRFVSGVRISDRSMAGNSRVEAEGFVQEMIEQNSRTPVVFVYDQYEYRTTLGDIAASLDTARVVEDVLQQEHDRNIWSKITNLDGSQKINYPIPLVYQDGVKAKLAAEWNTLVGAESKNARLEMDSRSGLTVIPEVNGLKVDIESTFKALPQQIGEYSNLEVPIILTEELPMVTKKDLEIMGELSTFTTWYKIAEENRTHNLTRAAYFVNGTVIAPGEVFSFNHIVGPRTGETGYRDAPVIVGNKLEPGVGGGICQVSSTLYNACLLAGLEIVERHNHNLAVAYVPLGFDATVAYGSIDFRFKNNTDYPIYIHSAAGGGKLTVNIYGHLEYKRKIQTKSLVDEVIPFAYLEEIDPQLAPGETRVDHKGFPGYRVRSYRYYLDEAGQIAKSELLSTDRYKAFNEITYIAEADKDKVPQPAQPEVVDPPQEGNPPVTPEEPAEEPGSDSEPGEVKL